MKTWSGGAVQSLGWMRKEGEEEGRRTEKGGLGTSQIAARWEVGWRDGGFRSECALLLVSVKGVGCGCRSRLSEWTMKALGESSVGARFARSEERGRGAGRCIFSK